MTFKLIFTAIKCKTMKRTTYILSIALMMLTLVPSCKKGVNVFTIQDDKTLGLQLKQEIANNPQEYPILPQASYPDAYAYLYAMRDTILSSDAITLREEFAWELYIIEDDNTLNAFCAPGGYIYVYTGLIKYLDSEDELAGVLAHEIAHADRRHSTSQLTKAYGLSTLLAVVLGENQNALTDIAQGLIGLSFSRKDESDADEFSVKYLCGSSYNAAGAAGFFEKIEAQGGQSVPQFLSTHPNPDNRIDNIYSLEAELNCPGDETYDARYQAFKNSLP